MEWIVEGVSLISISAFITAATAFRSGPSIASEVYGVAIGTLIVLAVVSARTGFKIDFLPYRLCPAVLLVSAALIALGAWA
jgi:hypothetical protein